MRARRHALALAAVSAMLLTSCSGSPGASGDEPLIVVSTNILGDVVGNLVGDQAEVVTLMRPNADPHSFEVSAQEAAMMRDADLLVASGLGLEEGLQQQLDAAADDGAPSFVAGDHVEVLAYREDAADGTGTAGADDPHFWTDPARMLDVVDALDAALAEIPAIDEEALEAASAAYSSRLEVLDQEMSVAFAALPAERRRLVTNHHVFGYLADRFDFEIVGAVIPGGSTLAAPSASDLRDLADAVREAQVPVVFAESSQPERLVQVLADEAGLDIEVDELFTESLTAPGGGAPDYLTMMRVNTERIATGLAP